MNKKQSEANANWEIAMHFQNEARDANMACDVLIEHMPQYVIQNICTELCKARLELRQLKEKHEKANNN